MSKAIHKGTELNNVKETWEKNEEEKANAGAPSAVGNDLQQTIRKEADEYDEANKGERILDGDRASVEDEKNS